LGRDKPDRVTKVGGKTVCTYNLRGMKVIVTDGNVER